MADLKSLLEIMAQLRDPEGGCPWDLEQDFSSISPHTIEEAYEVDEAIASGNLERLRDELGDLLFQVVFQARIAEECGAFDFEGVIEAIVSKLIRRHPHIFADAEMPESVSDQARHWESIKDAERKAESVLGGGPVDLFAGIPRNLPALARSAKLAGRLAKIGHRGADAAPDEIMTRLDQTLASAAEALRKEAGLASEREAALRLVGEGLHAWVGLARALGVDPEQALRRADDERIAAVGRE